MFPGTATFAAHGHNTFDDAASSPPPEVVFELVNGRRRTGRARDGCGRGSTRFPLPDGESGAVSRGPCLRRCGQCFERLGAKHSTTACGLHAFCVLRMPCAVVLHLECIVLHLECVCVSACVGKKNEKNVKNVNKNEKNENKKKNEKNEKNENKNEKNEKDGKDEGCGTQTCSGSVLSRPSGQSAAGRTRVSLQLQYGLST